MKRVVDKLFLLSGQAVKAKGQAVNTNYVDVLALAGLVTDR